MTTSTAADLKAEQARLAELGNAWHDYYQIPAATKATKPANAKPSRRQEQASIAEQRAARYASTRTTDRREHR